MEEEQADLENEDLSAGSDEDSMIASGSEDELDGSTENQKQKQKKPRTTTARAPSPQASTTSTNLDSTPEALFARFPTLFSTDPAPVPKILITTDINGTIHKEAESLTNLFQNSVYIPRSSHRYSHRFSVQEIASFASNRGYTAVLVLKVSLRMHAKLSRGND